LLAPCDSLCHPSVHPDVGPTLPCPRTIGAARVDFSLSLLPCRASPESLGWCP